MALNDAAVWSYLPGPSGAFYSSCHADFGVELVWEAPHGREKCDQTATSMHMSKPSVMWDGRLAYIARARRSPAALEHDALDGQRPGEEKLAVFVPKNSAKIGHGVPCWGPRQTRIARHKLAVDVSLAVGGPRCPSQHELCKKKSRNAKNHIRQNG